MKRYDAVGESAWVSGYRNKVLGDGMGDDTLGYDLVIERQRSSLLFEVKSSAGGEGEFVLSPTEIARARSLRKRETFHVLSWGRGSGPGGAQRSYCEVVSGGRRPWCLPWPGGRCPWPGRCGLRLSQFSSASWV
ncbi:protein NO VEIN domain-containing protein [Streptomyces sp. NPDC053429]|uniref:protein NO VEIN domain-containing protein n=1 Tax=Streptomyces sp. NPDC053429 TaxID=3365702 RepID=UPI0037D1A4F4